MRLRVATYNIHKGVVNDVRRMRSKPTMHELRQRLQTLDADIIFLQEVQGQNQRHARRFEHLWPSEPQDKFLAQCIGNKGPYEAVYGANANYLHGHHGNALLSQFPVLQSENRDFSDNVLEKRGVLHCVLRLPGQNVHCFVIHFGLFAKGRIRQTDALIEWIQSEVDADAPLLIAGDFNDWRDQLSTRLNSALNVRDVLGGARTFPALAPWLRLDRMYVRGFQVGRATVMRGAEWARLSDHAPLVADLICE